jgi:hypothetical protein
VRAEHWIGSSLRLRVHLIPLTLTLSHPGEGTFSQAGLERCVQSPPQRQFSKEDTKIAKTEEAELDRPVHG